MQYITFLFNFQAQLKKNYAVIQFTTDSDFAPITYRWSLCLHRVLFSDTSHGYQKMWINKFAIFCFPWRPRAILPWKGFPGSQNAFKVIKILLLVSWGKPKLLFLALRASLKLTEAASGHTLPLNFRKPSGGNQSITHEVFRWSQLVWETCNESDLWCKIHR